MKFMFQLMIELLRASSNGIRLLVTLPSMPPECEQVGEKLLLEVVAEMIANSASKVLHLHPFISSIIAFVIYYGLQFSNAVYFWSNETSFIVKK